MWPMYVHFLTFKAVASLFILHKQDSLLNFNPHLITSYCSIYQNSSFSLSQFMMGKHMLSSFVASIIVIYSYFNIERLSYPLALAVTQTNNHCVKVFSIEGKFLNRWGTQVSPARGSKLRRIRISSTK